MPVKGGSSHKEIPPVSKENQESHVSASKIPVPDSYEHINQHPSPLTVEKLVALVLENNPKADTSLITKAYSFSNTAHHDQKRQSGEPFFNHPLGVATILAEMKLDTVTIATGLLHDTVEDTYMKLEQIEEQFGLEIATLVDGVTKISKISFQDQRGKASGEFQKNGPCHGKRLACHPCQAGGPSAQHAHA